MLLAFYLISVIYCVWKLNKTWKRGNLGGGIGMSPGLDMLMVLLIAPLLIVVDVVVTWINRFKN